MSLLAMSLGDRFCVSRKGGTGQEGWYTQRVKTAWPCLGWLWKFFSRAISFIVSTNGPRKQSFDPCRLSALHEQLTINELMTTDSNLVCSLEPENQMIARALFMLSIHSPDNVLMVLVSIIISSTDHFAILLPES